MARWWPGPSWKDKLKTEAVGSNSASFWFDGAAFSRTGSRLTASDESGRGLYGRKAGADTLKAAGLTVQAASRCEKLAAILKPEFEEYVIECKAVRWWRRNRA